VYDRSGVVNAYSRPEVARIFRISTARLRYWQRTDLVRPEAGAPACEATASASGARGPAVARGFGFRDLVRIRRVVGLLKRGVPLRRIRRSLRDARNRLPELEDPLPALRLWGEGAPLLVVEHEGRLFEPDGQLVMDFRTPSEAERPLTELRRPPAAEQDEGLDAYAWFERGCALDADPASAAEAAEAYENALALDPEFADAHCNLGTVLYNQGRRREALTRFRRALACAPFHREANFNLANLLEEQGAGKEALRHYRAVLRIDPLYADAHVNLALLLERLGARRRARDHWRLYLQIEPDGPWSEIARRHLSSPEGAET